MIVKVSPCGCETVSYVVKQQIQKWIEQFSCALRVCVSDALGKTPPTSTILSALLTNKFLRFSLLVLMFFEFFFSPHNLQGYLKIIQTHQL